ncbi:FAD-dependent oxidoreductase [Paraburkholderia dipogonis]|uniref:FAD-dependent oxidoreductase n=1 Tax=Paraburkholderia dipogonis TaxID=1211383 RepID=A0A4Y8MGC2_9BURK|nr:FAD-dependent oxidoreductase [Paraburkholderia dipogonis]TFE36516.1 FAD-dependent oxidoreductase [Paraburkholderia dipogonis]
MRPQSTSDSVVIYGGGMAGAMLARALSSAASVTLVDPLDFFEVPMAVPRNLVNAKFSERAIIPFASALPRVKHVQGRLITMRPACGLVEDIRGKEMEIEGKVTVLATGSRFANELMRGTNGTVEERKSFYARYSKRIESAKRIVIVGGGPIGVEVAGEIAEAHAHKNITIVEAGPRILSGTTAEVAAHAGDLLDRRGVVVRTNERIVEGGSSPHDVFSKSGLATTSRGTRLPYDLMIWCTGGSPNTGYMQKHYASVLNAQGRVMVTPELLIAGRSSMYALGDITDLDENKMAWHIGGQVKIAASNIAQSLAGQRDLRRLKKYRPKTGNPSMVITVGSRSGVAHLKGFGIVRSDWFVSVVKANDMLVSKYRKALGV